MPAFNPIFYRHFLAASLCLLMNNIYAVSIPATDSMQPPNQGAILGGQIVSTPMENIAGINEDKDLQRDSSTPLPPNLSLSKADMADQKTKLNSAINLVNSGIEANIKSAVTILAQLSKQGNAVAQLMLGKMYINGESGEKNTQSAVGLLTDSANAGNTEAMRILAYLYEHGDGVEKNPETARAWYKKAYPLASNHMDQATAASLILLIVIIVVITGILLYGFLFTSRTILVITMDGENIDEIWDTFMQKNEVFFIHEKSWPLNTRQHNKLQFTINRALAGNLKILREQSIIQVQLSCFKMLSFLGIYSGTKQIGQEISHLYAESVNHVNAIQSALTEHTEKFEINTLNKHIDELISYIEALQQNQPETFRIVEELFSENRLQDHADFSLNRQPIWDLIHQFSECRAANEPFDILIWQPLRDIIANEAKSLTTKQTLLLAKIEATYFYPCMVAAIMNLRTEIISKEWVSIPSDKDMTNAEIVASIEDVSWMLTMSDLIDRYFVITDNIKQLADDISEYLVLSDHPLLTACFHHPKLIDIRHEFYALIDDTIAIHDLQQGLHNIAAMLQDIPGFLELGSKGKAAILMAAHATSIDNLHYPIEIAQRIHKSYNVSLTERPDEHGDRSMTGLGNYLFTAMTYSEYMDWENTKNYLQLMLQTWINHIYPKNAEQLRARLGQASTIGEAELIKQDMESLHTVKTQCQRLIREYMNAHAQRKYELSLNNTALKMPDMTQYNHASRFNDNNPSIYQRVYLRTG